MGLLQSVGAKLTKIMEEQWKQIPGLSSYYEVSNLGRVRSSYSGNFKLLSPWSNQGGYQSVTLDRQNWLISHLVLLAFVGPKPTNSHIAAHNDGNNKNNILENLRWATYQENEDDKLRHGTRALGEKHHGAKLSDKEVQDIREEYELGKTSHRELSRKYGVDHRTIGRIVNKQYRIYS